MHEVPFRIRYLIWIDISDKLSFKTLLGSLHKWLEVEENLKKLLWDIEKSHAFAASDEKESSL